MVALMNVPNQKHLRASVNVMKTRNYGSLGADSNTFFTSGYRRIDGTPFLSNAVSPTASAPSWPKEFLAVRLL